MDPKIEIAIRNGNFHHTIIDEISEASYDNRIDLIHKSLSVESFSGVVNVLVDRDRSLLLDNITRLFLCYKQRNHTPDFVIYIHNNYPDVDINLMDMNFNFLNYSQIDTLIDIDYRFIKDDDIFIRIWSAFKFKNQNNIGYENHIELTKRLFNHLCLSNDSEQLRRKFYLIFSHHMTYPPGKTSKYHTPFDNYLCEIIKLYENNLGIDLLEIPELLEKIKFVFSSNLTNVIDYLIDKGLSDQHINIITHGIELEDKSSYILDRLRSNGISEKNRLVIFSMSLSDHLKNM